MSAPLQLPPRPDLHWLKNRAQDKLVELRRVNPSAQLADAQLEMARAYGFPSWRALKARVDELRAALPAAAAPPSGESQPSDEPPPAAESQSPEVTADQVVGAFLKAVGTGRLDDARRMLELAPQLVNAVGPHPFWGGRPQALHVSIESNRRELFDLLLVGGADVDGSNQGYGNWSPLLLTVHRKHPEWTAVLLERGARVGLAEALALGDDGRLDQILDAEGDRVLAMPAPNDGTFLHFARTPHSIDRLLSLGGPADRKDRWGATPVEAMSRRGPAGAPLVARLAARGAKVGPAELARIGDRAALERLRAEDPAAFRLPATLKAAVDFGHRELARWLVATGCDVNGRAGGPANETPLHTAAWNGDLETVRLLVELGADLHARDRQYDAVPLGWAETAIDVTNNPRCAEVAEFLRPLTDTGKSLVDPERGGG